jgi:mannose-6-phosphate isomerase-like protein (cupin superfamily)
MRNLTLCLLPLLLLLPRAANAQAPQRSSTELPAAEVASELARAMADAVAGTRAVVDRNLVVDDMGDYGVAVAVVVRPGGDQLGAVLSHDGLTEIYYVVRGSGVHVTGGITNPERMAPSTAVGPGWTSTSPIANGKATRLAPGDIQIIPPGVAHGFTSIDPGGIEYLVFRVDTERAIAPSSRPQ